MEIPFIGKLFSSGIKETAEAIGSLAKDIRQAITGEISPEKKAEIEQKLIELENRSIEMQNQINLAEAQHSNFFCSRSTTFHNLGMWICFVLQLYFTPINWMGNSFNKPRNTISPTNGYGNTYACSFRFAWTWWI